MNKTWPDSATETINVSGPYTHTEVTMCNQGDPVDREERRDDEELDEFFGTTWKANVKESFDIHRGDDRMLYRAMVREYLADASQERRQREELFSQRMRHVEAEFDTRQRGSEQSLAHRDLAIAQEWRDQARDSQSGQEGGDKSP